MGDAAIVSVIALGHSGITVPDLDAAISFYDEALGLEPIGPPIEVSSEDPRVRAQLLEVFGLEQVVFRQAHLAVPGGSALELFEFLQPPGLAPGGFQFTHGGVHHLCFQVADIEAAAARIEKAGGRRRTAVMEIFPGERYRFCYCTDIFGNAIELASHPHAEAFGGRNAY